MCPQMVGHLLTWWGLGPPVDTPLPSSRAVVDVNPGEAETVQVGGGMLSTVIKIKRAECCLAMRPGRDYCPAQNNIIRVRRLKECPLFPAVFRPDKSPEQLHFHHGSCYLQKDDGGSIARSIVTTM